MDGHKPWRPKTHEPHFFNLYVNDKCHRPEDSDYDINSDPPADVYADPIALANMKKNYCPLEGYAIRLEHGNVIATPYNKWWDPKLPTFFVDDDTQCYTVSKEPLQLYVDSSTGALKYTKVGWMPPNSLSVGFYRTGNNPLGIVGRSPSYFTWPITPGISENNGEWDFCWLGDTKQYQVFVNRDNFESAGVKKNYCVQKRLAAANANPWQKKKPHWGDKPDHGYETD
ncbi:hypothetical protein BU26DRAFT_532287 [Trematosphaeria pertusa]|uniref:Uncharacterized protein n=1 Tax=Trematosphaeria pertusa TaxID=390896 RepID=A0A6A6I7U5_9PLEO|nr:uncharacterized protein BU26DRAFT_532287 [Trematosphaeria pertusa]KAF2246441.1 hypothetical protein BU26DRAFT_532287 [Trematosphaeria pertusa]